MSQEKFRHELDKAASELDSIVVARLRGARLHALDAAMTRPTLMGWWMPLSGAIAATVVAITVGLLWWHTPEPTLTAAGDDMEWLAAKESPDLFSEQLEFYEWLNDDNDAS